jgi:hypothetical protein
MNCRKLLATSLFFIMAFSLSVPLVRADMSNQQIKITVTEAVAIPGHILAPGTYWFALVGDGADLNTVQVFNADRSALLATLFTAPRDRQQAGNGPAFTLAERPYSQPEAILAWFYPGRTTGHEFLYPKSEAKELARDAHRTLPLEASAEFQGN